MLHLGARGLPTAKAPSCIQRLTHTTLPVYVPELQPWQPMQIGFHLLAQEDHLPAQLTVGKSLPEELGQVVEYPEGYVVLPAQQPTGFPTTV
jgi:hypothetical protein